MIVLYSNVGHICDLKFSRSHIKKKLRLILIIDFIESSIQNTVIVACKQHDKLLLRYFILLFLFSYKIFDILKTTCLYQVQLNCKCCGATGGQWLLDWTAQVQKELVMMRSCVLCHLRLVPFPRGNLCFSSLGLVFLLLPPFLKNIFISVLPAFRQYSSP